MLFIQAKCQGCYNASHTDSHTVLGFQFALFSYGRDGHQLYSRGLRTDYTEFPIKGGMTMTQRKDFTPPVHMNAPYHQVKLQ